MLSSWFGTSVANTLFHDVSVCRCSASAFGECLADLSATRFLIGSLPLSSLCKAAYVLAYSSQEAKPARAHSLHASALPSAARFTSWPEVSLQYGLTGRSSKGEERWRGPGADWEGWVTSRESASPCTAVLPLLHDIFIPCDSTLNKRATLTRSREWHLAAGWR